MHVLHHGPPQATTSTVVIPLVDGAGRRLGRRSPGLILELVVWLSLMAGDEINGSTKCTHEKLNVA